jgi:hypothetical protein
MGSGRKRSQQKVSNGRDAASRRLTAYDKNVQVTGHMRCVEAAPLGDDLA